VPPVPLASPMALVRLVELVRLVGLVSKPALGWVVPEHLNGGVPRQRQRRRGGGSPPTPSRSYRLGLHTLESVFLGHR